MRELTVRLRFTLPSLGNVKDERGQFRMIRDGESRVLFMRSWHVANMVFVAALLGRHQDEVAKICWDPVVDGTIAKGGWYRRYYKIGGRERYVLHEAFFAKQIVGINCVVPTRIGDDDFWRLVAIAGQYRGLSPWKPGDFGHYEVVSLRPRAVRPVQEEEVKEREPDSFTADPAL